MIHLYIDDERQMPPQFNVHAKTVPEALQLLEQYKRDGTELGTIAFDHDMGFGRDENGMFVEWTTRPILQWVIDNDFWPVQLFVHSYSPAGGAWLEATAREHAPEGVFIERVNDRWYYQ